jgi:glycine cleavage system transcriptional repressor
MKSYLAICGIGPDHSGFVDAVSEYLAGRNLNIEQSRATVLGKEFGLMLLVSGEAIAINAFADDREHFIKNTKIAELIMRKTESPQSRQIPQSLPYELEATSLDHPGIVKKLTGVLNSHGVNIENIRTNVSPAPVTGTPVFSLNAIISVPTDVKISVLRDDLYEISDQENVDISFGPVGT